MAAWITVTLLIIIGLALINIEVVFVPGTTFVGLIGLLIAGAGVFFSFVYFNSTIGFIVLGVTLTLTLGSLVYFFKNNTWKNFALMDSNKGKVNEGLTGALQVGAEGVAISALRPVGKAEFWGKQFEVTTLGSYLEAGTKITIVKIESNKILVEPIEARV